MIAFGIDYAVLLLLYYLAHVNLEVATATGFIIGFAVSFTANRQWVFAASKHKKSLHWQLIEYIMLVIFNFVFTVAAVAFLNNLGVKPFAGKLLVMGIIMCWNYALFRWIIFAELNK